MSKKYLFYISQNYSFEILRPLQKLIRDRGDNCAWFVEGIDVNLSNFLNGELQLKNIDDVKRYQPCAVFIPGNAVPNFISGLKVQVFHGLEWKKKGHFTIRGLFDLYCTHGEITTSRFNQLAKQHGNFHVKETGWPKLDPLFQTTPLELNTTLPVVLFAPTFSPNLSCAVECFDEIKRLVNTDRHYWIVKFHPKMKKQWIALYQQIVRDNYQIIKADSCLPLLQRADVLVSDTSSIISEFLLLDKPAVTYKNADPGEYLINITQPALLQRSIELALKGSEELIKQIKLENSKTHPYKDGLSSQRILDAVDELIASPVLFEKKKPLNLLRNFKVRSKLNYWRL
ncbi:MAG: CDP-glycerol--glycerophosphate glycerophosphotransferase [Gammaproteobacteria bacterium]|nr:MAG: CDP-glycerol--glycerophosphate glycerophosphotransferase [Gammaproteobacteria bacterium]